MSKIYYAPSHEYVMVDGNIGHVGISDYAQKALGNIVYVDMPEQGDDVTAGEEFGAVESVKAAEDLLSGKRCCAQHQRGSDRQPASAQ